MNINLISNLQRLRTGNNLTLENVSNLTGIELSRMQSIENGYVEPNMEELKAISNFYGLTPAQLFANQQNQYQQQTNNYGSQQTKTTYYNPKVLHITTLVVSLLTLLAYFVLPFYYTEISIGKLSSKFLLTLTCDNALLVVLSIFILLILLYTTINSVIHISLKNETTSGYVNISKYLNLCFSILCLICALIIIFHYAFTPIVILTLLLYISLFTLSLLVMFKTKNVADIEETINKKAKNKVVTYLKNPKGLKVTTLVFAIIVSLINIISACAFMGNYSYYYDSVAGFDGRIGCAIIICLILICLFDSFLSCFMKKQTSNKLFKVFKYVNLVSSILIFLISSTLAFSHLYSLIEGYLGAIAVLDIITIIFAIINTCIKRRVKSEPQTAIATQQNFNGGYNQYSYEQPVRTYANFNLEEELKQQQRPVVQETPAPVQETPVQAPVQETVATTPSYNDETNLMIKQLKQIEALKESGILTEEEYQIKRRKIIMGE